MCSRPRRTPAGQAPFWTLFWPSLAANVGYWITLSLNIPDFTRYAKTQRSQIIGQALGLPLDDGFLFHRDRGHGGDHRRLRRGDLGPGGARHEAGANAPLLLILAMIIIAIAQISTNMAANVVSPSFDFSNLAPSTSRSGRAA